MSKYRVEECYTLKGKKVWRVIIGEFKDGRAQFLGDFDYKEDADTRAYELNTQIE